MNNFENELATLITKWLDRGCDAQTIINALKLHAAVMSLEKDKDPNQTELPIE